MMVPECDSEGFLFMSEGVGAEVRSPPVALTVRKHPQASVVGTRFPDYGAFAESALWEVRGEVRFTWQAQHLLMLRFLGRDFIGAGAMDSLHCACVVVHFVRHIGTAFAAFSWI